MPGDDLLRVVAFERRGAGEHLEQHHAHAVDVGARVHVLAAQRLLGAHVERGADDESGLGVAGGAVEVLDDAEVHQQRATGSVLDEDVVGLHVPMHQALLVGVLQGLEDGLGDRERPAHRQGAVRAEHLGERPSLAVGHHVEHQPLGLAHEMDGQRVGVAEPRDGPPSCLKPLSVASLQGMSARSTFTARRRCRSSSRTS